MVDSLRDKLIPQYIKVNGALNVPLLKNNPELYAELVNFQIDKSLTTLGIAFQHVKQEIDTVPLCYCGNQVKWKSETSSYNIFCSTKCSAGSNEKKDKIKNTCIEKYGVSNPSKSPDIRATAQDTMEVRYGIRHAMHSDKFKNKVKDTTLEKYGTQSVFNNNDIKAKIKSTMIERYGVDNASKSSTIRKQAEETCVLKFGGCSPMSSESVKLKVRSTNQHRYGVENPGQRNLKDGVLEKLQTPDWLLSENTDKNISEIAADLDVTTRTVSQYFIKHGIQYKRHSNSMFESEIVNFIKSLGIHDLELNNRTILSGSEIDILIPSKNIAFECNGSYWHSELNGKDKNYHLTKTSNCKLKGIRLVHLWEHDWKSKNAIVKSRISSFLGVNSRIHARKCEVREVPSIVAAKFLNETHIQGSCPASICIGLYYIDELVSIMTFGKSRYDKSIDYELLRYSSLCGINVIGGAGRLFKNFVKNHPGESIVSYSDISWNTGNLYINLGFALNSTSPPAYHYTKDYINFENRVKYQKHKLRDVLKYFDPDLTEWQNMQNNGYDRIWNCGNKKYIY